jgi:hypothetical protein
MRAQAWMLAVGLLFATPAAAQNDFERQVRAYLENGMSVHAALGYRRDRSNMDVVAPLELESPYLWSVYLREGVNYRVYGACDNDCSDLDMEIYGADGHLADRDVSTDDVPYVQITPTRSGRHFVRIWLYACGAEPCYIGARVVEGGTPAERLAQPARDEETRR